MSLIFALLILAGLFLFFRQIERWLHQHIFKVGWLLTQNYQTTTILYYTFFLPGVIAHEFTIWLVAGMLNVRADRAIAIPEKQEIGELKLNFVRINPRISAIKKAVISASPLMVGIVFIWHVGTNVFRVQDVAQIISTGQLNDVGRGLTTLTSTPDFWLWIYLAFAVSNTMFPHTWKEFQPFRAILLLTALIVLLLSLIGISQLLTSITVSLSALIFQLQSILTFMITINIIMTLSLGLIEYIVESTTHRSATFRKGKMITMTRDEAIAEREKERKRQQKTLSFTEKAFISVYQLTFPIPGSPGKEPVTQMKLTLMLEERQKPTNPVTIEKTTTIPPTIITPANINPEAHPSATEDLSSTDK